MDMKKLNTIREKAREAYSSNDFLKATLYLEELFSYSPNDVEAHFIKANIFHLQGKIGKAIKLFKQVIDLDPQHTDAMISLSVLLNDIGRYDEAQKFFDMADSKVKKGDSGVIDAHINKKFSYHHYEIAELYSSYHRYDEALFEYNKAYSLDPSHQMIRVKIAKIYAKKGFISKAFEELRSLKSENPNFIPARMALGILHYSNGHIIEAQNEWQNILNKEPVNQEAKMYLNLSKSASETQINSPLT